MAQELCLDCGLCCNGALFADVVLQPGDASGPLRALANPRRAARSAPRPLRLPQPCAAWDGCRCRFYRERPQYCRDFACALFKSVQAGTTGTAAALRVIRDARRQVDRVRQLLRALGDDDLHLPLSARFRRTARRLEEREPGPDVASNFSELTLAMHNLNLLLADSFYPGRPQPAPKAAATRTALSLTGATALLFSALLPARADQVELTNGDRYVGYVLSVNSNTVVLQSDVLGNARLPRSKVAVISFGRIPGTNSTSRLSPTNTPPALASNAVADLNPALRRLGASTNLIRQVQQQFLSGAGTEANAKFNELLNGLITGNLDVNDIRAQAKSAADQLRTLQKESGEESSFAASAYLSILDHFLKETAPATTKSNAATKTKPPPAEE